MEKRFRALRIIGTLLKVLAWIELVATMLGALALAVGGIAGAIGQVSQQDIVPGLAVGGVLAGIVAALGVLILGLLYFLLLYAASEGIYVVLSIEENTRLTAAALSGRTSV